MLVEALLHPMEDLRLVAVRGLKKHGTAEDWQPVRVALDQTSPLHATKAFPRDPMGIEIPRSEHSVPPDEVLDLLALRLAHGGNYDTKRR